MKIILALLALAAIASAAPPSVTVACDVPLPLNGTIGVRFYDRSGPNTAYVYKLLADVPVTSALTTGTLKVSATFPLVPDGITHTVVARTYSGTATVLPSTAASFQSEAADSNAVTTTLPVPPPPATSFRVTSVKLQ